MGKLTPGRVGKLGEVSETPAYIYAIAHQNNAMHIIQEATVLGR